MFNLEKKLGLALFLSCAAAHVAQNVTQWSVHSLMKQSQFLFFSLSTMLSCENVLPVANSTLIHKVGNTTLWRGV